MNRGTFISGAGHLILIVGLIVGDWLGDWMKSEARPPEVADVAIVSEREYAALVLPPIQPPSQSEIPDTLAQQSEESPVPAPELAVSLPAVDTPDPIVPDDTQTSPEAPETPDVSESPVSESFDDPTIDIAVAEPLLSSSPDAPVTETTSTPRDAPRIAPVPVLESPPTPKFADTPVPQVSPESESPDVAIDLPEAAPEEATTEIVTEAETPSLAPAIAAIPVLRPVRRPVPAPDPEPEQDSAEEPEPETDQSSERPRDELASIIEEAVVAAAEAEANPGGERSTPVAAALSPSEIAGFRAAVQRCWNVGALSSEALMVTVTVGISMTPDGRPSEPRLLGYSGGSEAAAGQAFDVARRAVLICGREGYKLPADSYERWREIEIKFNPEKMRLK